MLMYAPTLVVMLPRSTALMVSRENPSFAATSSWRSLRRRRAARSLAPSAPSIAGTFSGIRSNVDVRLIARIISYYVVYSQHRSHGQAEAAKEAPGAQAIHRVGNA